MGKYDLVEQVLAEFQAEFLFHQRANSTRKAGSFRPRPMRGRSTCPRIITLCS